MKTVAILSDFDGYPDGEKRQFVTGETPTLDEAYADLLIKKGLADEIPSKTEAPGRATSKEKQS